MIIQAIAHLATAAGRSRKPVENPVGLTGAFSLSRIQTRNCTSGDELPTLRKDLSTMAPGRSLEEIASSRRALLGAVVGMLLAVPGIVLPEWLREAEAREGANSGKLGGRHGKNRRGRSQRRSHGRKKHRNTANGNKGVNQGRDSAFRDCSQVPKVPGADLSHCELSDAQLSGVDLTGANLFQANLARANLFRSTLTRANLSGAILAYADLVDTDLSDAKLIGANLKYADLTQAGMDGADFTGAQFCHTRMQSGGERNDNCP